MHATATLDRDANRADRIRHELDLKTPSLAKTGLVTAAELDEAAGSVGADLFLRILTAANLGGLVDGARAEARERGDRTSTYLDRLAHLTG
jgi:hypothetical protein